MARTQNSRIRGPNSYKYINTNKHMYSYTTWCRTERLLPLYRPNSDSEKCIRKTRKKTEEIKQIKIIGLTLQYWKRCDTMASQGEPPRIFNDGKPRQLTRTAYGLEAAKDPEHKLTQDVKNSDEKSALKATIHQLFDDYIIDTAKRIAEECKEKRHDLSEWDYDIFYNIALCTGLRKGAIHALKWCDIDGEYLSVKHSISQQLRGGDGAPPSYPRPAPGRRETRARRGGAKNPTSRRRDGARLRVKPAMTGVRMPPLQRHTYRAVVRRKPHGQKNKTTQR